MELTDYLNILRKRWIVIVAITVVVVAGVLAFSFLQKKVYEAKATSMVSATTTIADQYSAVQIIEQLLQTINNIAVSRSVLEDASTRLDKRVSANQLQGAIKSQVLLDTQLIVTAARDENPTMAMLEANAAADSLRDFVNKKAGNDGPYKIEKVDRALTPNSPISPKPRRNAILGGFLGLILGIAVAAVLESIDVSVKSKDELSQILELPVLAEIPLSSDDSVAPNAKNIPGDPGILEQTRTLRTNIQYMDLDSNLRIILITSPNLGEGKTFISSQLARAFVASGKKVILVDADLRKVKHGADHAHSPGLTDVIMRTVDIKEVLQKKETDGFWLLPSGVLPPNPSELLDSASMRDILDSLRTDFHVVIVDSSPIGIFSDPLALASKADGTILVAGAGSTSTESLKSARDLLTGPNINLLGSVLNKVKASKRQAYYYYHYYSHPGRGQDSRRRETRRQVGARHQHRPPPR